MTEPTVHRGTIFLDSADYYWICQLEGEFWAAYISDPEEDFYLVDEDIYGYLDFNHGFTSALEAKSWVLEFMTTLTSRKIEKYQADMVLLEELRGRDLEESGALAIGRDRRSGTDLRGP